ncbi:hypothetical protein DPMN_035302 [Dreissena polymorpha]|uniref:Hexosyltransferase n=1 Tax=Dreissena polymorpha TaxID=45954 RepID=A0A9D4M987_DREPO|nr:hypothetical protein DPMN_035302 [Dreissena polymorpha]
MKSDFNHLLKLYFTDSIVFKTNGIFESSTIAYGNSSFDQKHNIRLDKTIAFNKLQHLPLNATAYRTFAFVGMNLTRTETSTEEMITSASRMKNEHLGEDDVPRNTNVRKSECDNCFKHDFEYDIQNDHICDTSEMHEQIDLLILVTSVHKNGFVRETLRSTWLSYSKNNTESVRHVFLLGQKADDRL